MSKTLRDYTVSWRKPLTIYSTRVAGRRPDFDCHSGAGLHKGVARSSGAMHPKSGLRPAYRSLRDHQRRASSRPARATLRNRAGQDSNLPGVQSGLPEPRSGDQPVCAAALGQLDTQDTIYICHHTQDTLACSSYCTPVAFGILWSAEGRQQTKGGEATLTDST